MFLTSALTVGQLTFILRAVIQILNYDGIFLIGYIVLASAPRIASLHTHDILNRVVGRETSGKTTRKWIFNAIRGRNGDPATSPRLILALTLLSVYGLPAALSDLGFLGLYACKTLRDFPDHPASVNSTEEALAMVKSALVNGTDPGSVKAYRCDSMDVIEIGDVNLGTDNTLRVSTSWHNSTFADPSIFTGINTTDSDMLLPVNIRHLNHSRSNVFDLNTYRQSFGDSLVLNATIRNGQVVEPHEGGLRVVFGVPSLQSGQSVNLEKAMAFEVEVGCMSLGIFASHILDASGNGLEYFSEKSDWRSYKGPDYMKDVLSRTVDDVRNVYSSIFNSSSKDGFRVINSTGFKLTEASRIDNFFLPDVGTTDGVDITRWIRGNCTEGLRKQLELDDTLGIRSGILIASDMCEPVTLTGMIAEDGDLVQVGSKMVCASASQINMVSGTISAAETGQVAVNITRLPSDLHVLHAEYFDAVVGPNGTQYNVLDPVLRYTLSDNPNGRTSHFIDNKDGRATVRRGTASAGSTLSRVGTTIINLGDLSFTDYDCLRALAVDSRGFNWSPSTAIRWFGQLGAAYVLNSLTYNGWVAASNSPVLVSDTAGPLGTCYRPPYAVSFIPLIVAAILVAAWILFLVITRALAGVRTVEDCYGGLKPYWGVVCPTVASQSALLAWENVPGPHLQLVSPGQVVNVGDASTAARHLTSPPQNAWKSLVSSILLCFSIIESEDVYTCSLVNTTSTKDIREKHVKDSRSGNQPLASEVRHTSTRGYHIWDNNTYSKAHVSNRR
ncbi:hypothetical protein Moror_11235 [Moniliophthora roreri MCA 2997]|uniref:Uncharacterized protein n=1 Tax=Moniliophthora roreri (strain MCA 2997) TaxID=1381753 RepID=V2WM43_MONRO|nr:hypothetical protein Moror_11235 [Moniliophthora roreri MCA 2997]